MARTNRRSSITRSTYAIRSRPQWDEVFGTHSHLLGSAMTRVSLPESFKAMLRIPLRESHREALAHRVTGEHRGEQLAGPSVEIVDEARGAAWARRPYRGCAIVRTSHDLDLPRIGVAVRPDVEVTASLRAALLLNRNR
jgi:hypothetical protein